MEDHKKKKELFLKWLHSHYKDNYSLVFNSLHPEYEPSDQLKSFLNDKGTSNFIYLLIFGHPSTECTPLYIGKTKEPKKRWLQGHIKQIQKERKNKSSYSKWHNFFHNRPNKFYLVCIEGSNIEFPPIPNFPKTVGSVEYQLISLASEGFDNCLFNSEGVSR